MKENYLTESMEAALDEAECPLLHRTTPTKKTGQWGQMCLLLERGLGDGNLFAMAGPNGVGKTQIASELIFTVLFDRSMTARYTTQTELALIFMDARRKSPTELAVTLEAFGKMGLLVVDNVEQGRSEAWEIDALHRLIHLRLINRNDTFLISSRSVKTLAQFVGKFMPMIEGGIIEATWPPFLQLQQKESYASTK